MNIKEIVLGVSVLAMSSSVLAVVPATFSVSDGFGGTAVLNDSGDELISLTDINGNLDDSGFDYFDRMGQNNTRDHEFGIYQYDANTDTRSDLLTIFKSDGQLNGGLYPNSGQTVTVSNTGGIFTLTTQVTATITDTLTLTNGIGYNFGFYFISDNDTFYSQAHMNTNGEDLFGLYWDTTPSDANLHIYMEDNDSGSSHDSLMVTATDVSVVPEPSIVALLGLGLVGMGVATRRKQKVA